MNTIQHFFEILHQYLVIQAKAWNSFTVQDDNSGSRVSRLFTPSSYPSVCHPGKLVESKLCLDNETTYAGSHATNLLFNSLNFLQLSPKVVRRVRLTQYAGSHAAFLDSYP